MKNNNAISVKNLHISYKNIQKTSIKKSIKKLRLSSAKTFEALKGVSFDVKKGEILGIVGKNGSGKSTMLRAIAGVFSADQGTIDLYDNTVSLLSIGVGFTKALTGYENIYLSGMLLGFSENQIKEKEQEIIEFSELGDFIYKPVQTYSSGMYSKLAFSITAILETNVMLIDEVLSVGDIHFKEKSYSKMKELISDDNRTVIIVSHNINTIKKLCTKVLWLHGGKIKDIGEPEMILKEYEDYMLKK
jgi:ABC-type polysaccharide/polyol phosphate transport system ATPase subunit